MRGCGALNPKGEPGDAVAWLGSKRFNEGAALFGIWKLGPTLDDLEQEQGSQFALRVQKNKMLPVDFSALCDDGLRADLGRFEPD